jgi:Ca2+-binding RTX toxin-like protein
MLANLGRPCCKPGGLLLPAMGSRMGSDGINPRIPPPWFGGHRICRTPDGLSPAKTPAPLAKSVPLFSPAPALPPAVEKGFQCNIFCYEPQNVLETTTPAAGYRGGKMPYETTGAAFVGVRRGGPQAIVNQHTDYSQEYPSVAILDSGDYIVAWRDQLGGNYNIYARRYRDGVALGDEFQVGSGSWGTGVTPLANGGYVVVWAHGLNGWAVSGQIYDASDKPVGAAFRVNSDAGYQPNTGLNPVQFTLSTCTLKDGGFVSVWYSQLQDGSYQGVFGQVFNADGSKRGSEFQANTYTRGDQLDPVVVAEGEGFLVAWTSENQNALGSGIYGQHFSATGSRIGSEQMLADTAGSQRDAALASGENGQLVMTWVGGDGESTEVYAQVINAQGGAGPVFQVSYLDTYWVQNPQVLVEPNGMFTIFWESPLPSGHNDIYARSYDARGVPLGLGVMVNDNSTSTHRINLHVALNDDASMVAVWGSYDEDGDYWGIVKQEIRPAGLYGTGGNDTIALNENTGGRIFGEAGTDTLSGAAYNDWLDGGAGNDKMTGGGGNDTYVVDSIYDQVVEFAGGGTDTVRSSVSHTLAANVEYLLLTGTVAINGTGNALANNLTGNAGANVLDGGAGADWMSGGLGNDTYVLDYLGDRVVEAAGGGVDTIRTAISYTLAAEIENLSLTGNAAVNGTGNALANTLAGNSAANTLDGKAGADLMNGAGGNDTYFVDNSGDRVIEVAGGGVDTIYSAITFYLSNSYEVENVILSGSSAISAYGNNLGNTLTGNNAANILNGYAGNDRLIGNGGNDSVAGGDGADLLAGGLGNDVLDGGAGADSFRFDTTLHATWNVDRINGFSAADDTILLDNDVFIALPNTGVLSAAQFRLGTTAGDADDRILYDQASGKIFYDPDGSGAAVAVLFAQVGSGTLLTSADFQII